MVEPVSYLSTVRQQYETLPFPRRDPEDERRMLIISPPDVLAKVNHYCFRGGRNLNAGFRVLVAGGGTGDSTIFLAEQLRGRKAEVVHLDLSKASMEVARRRAAIRGLENIRWINASILDIPELDFGRFDYVSCLGVLHHLESPEQGLASLTGVLADDGAMAIMLYGKYGRTHTYQTQEMLRLVNTGEHDPSVRIANAKTVLRGLPPTNLFRRTEGDQAVLNDYLNNLASLYDDLLSEQDQPFGARDLHVFFQKQGLNLVQFTTYQGIRPTCRLQYELGTYIQDAALLSRLNALDPPSRQEIAEIVDGSLSLHTCYISRSRQTIANFHALENVPFFMTSHAREAADWLQSGANLPVVLRSGHAIEYRPGALARRFLVHVDGKQTTGEILNLMAGSPEFASLVIERAPALDALARDLDFMTALNWVLLRSGEVPETRPIPIATAFKVPYVYEEPVQLPGVAPFPWTV